MHFEARIRAVHQLGAQREAMGKKNPLRDELAKRMGGSARRQAPEPGTMNLSALARMGIQIPQDVGH